ncbi:hypothetical protein HBI80_202580 [Parastagonospora nodorum]|nr:hypothetical protein HBI80_202580 [Parastagonospora nodorum]
MVEVFSDPHDGDEEFPIELSDDEAGSGIAIATDGHQSIILSEDESQHGTGDQGAKSIAPAKSTARTPVEVFPMLNIPFSIEQLGDTSASVATTTAQLQQVIPQLTVANPDVAALMAQPATTRPPNFHTAYRDGVRTDWPSTYPEMDIWFEDKIKTEPQDVKLRRVIGRKGRPSRDEGHIDMRRDYGVKPSGDKNDDLMVVSSYPNYNSTIKDFALVRDPSNLSMGDTYSKIGARNHVFHYDLFMRRVDKRILRGDGASEDSIRLDELPREQMKHWDAASLELWKMSTARVALLLGSKTTQAYKGWMLDGKIHATPVDLPWTARVMIRNNKSSIAPAGFLEHGDATDRTKVTRLVLVSLHPEAYSRFRKWGTANTRLVAATREKIFDLALIYVFGHSPHPGFLSRRAYVHHAESGVLIPLALFEDLKTNKATILPLLNGPLCR